MVNGSQLLQSAGEPLKAISLFGTGHIIIWIIWSFALSFYAGNEVKDKIVGTIILLTAGMLLFYSGVQEKIVLAIAIVLTIILGLIKVLREK